MTPPPPPPLKNPGYAPERVVSSAYKNVVADVIATGRSLVKSSNKIGPSIDPYGMSYFTGKVVDSVLLTDVHCLLFSR